MEIEPDCVRKWENRLHALLKKMEGQNKPQLYIDGIHRLCYRDNLNDVISAKQIRHSVLRLLEKNNIRRFVCIFDLQASVLSQFAMVKLDFN